MNATDFDPLPRDHQQCELCGQGRATTKRRSDGKLVCEMCELIRTEDVKTGDAWMQAGE